MEKAEIERFYRELGARIRLQREQVDGGGLTQEQLGERVKLSRTSIVNIEKGRQHIGAHQLYVFAEALGIAPTGLLPERLDDSWVAERLAASEDRTIVQWAKKLE